MKISSMVFQSFLTACALFCSSSVSFGQSGEAPRWDLLMIKEAPIWKNLLVDYPLADHRKYWPERKKALEKVLHEHPDSRWADDAALMLACGKASFEGDKAGAVSDLKKIASRPDPGQTIVTSWSPDGGCRVDEIWLMWQGSLVFLNPDGSVRIAKPFDKDGRISPLEQEVLDYFSHLDRYPSSTRVTAQLFAAEILESMNNRADAVTVLENIVSNAEGYLAVLSRADQAAASQASGYYLRSLVRRPEYRAYLSLIRLYELQHKTDKAIEKADTLVKLSSSDGWLWSVNKQIGDVYDRTGQPGKAEAQQKLALSGLQAFRIDEENRKKLVGGSELPDDYFDVMRREIEMKLNKKSPNR